MKAMQSLFYFHFIFQLKATGLRAITGLVSKIKNVYSLDMSDNGTVGIVAVNDFNIPTM